MLKQLETGNFHSAWGGIASLQLGLAATWTQARERGHTPVHLARWLSTRPAEIVGLADKGRLAPGYAGDICTWDPEATWKVDGAALEHRHPVTPYHGMELHGRVTATYLAGRLVYERGTVIGAPSGRLLTRRAT
jgi:allantoinase